MRSFVEDVDIRRQIFLSLPRKGIKHYISRIERFQIDAIEFKRTQIHFFSDVFTPVFVGVV